MRQICVGSRDMPGLTGVIVLSTYAWLGNAVRAHLMVLRMGLYLAPPNSEVYPTVINRVINALFQ